MATTTYKEIEDEEDVTSKHQKQSSNKDHEVTLLWQACATGMIEIVDLLLITGHCDVNFCRPSGQVSCLYIAAQNGYCEACHRLLCEDKIDVNVGRRDTGATPLFIATQRHHTDIVSLLLMHGADVDRENVQHCTPLVLACNMGHYDVVVMLLNYGADLNNNKTGKTALQWARSEGRQRVQYHLQSLLLPTLRQKFVFLAWVHISQLRREHRQEKEKKLRDIDEARAAVRNGGPLPSLEELCNITIQPFTFSTNLVPHTCLKKNTSPLSHHPSHQQPEEEEEAQHSPQWFRYYDGVLSKLDQSQVKLEGSASSIVAEEGTIQRVPVQRSSRRDVTISWEKSSSFDRHRRPTASSTLLSCSSCISHHHHPIQSSHAVLWAERLLHETTPPKERFGLAQQLVNSDILFSRPPSSEKNKKANREKRTGDESNMTPPKRTFNFKSKPLYQHEKFL